MELYFRRRKENNSHSNHLYESLCGKEWLWWTVSWLQPYAFQSQLQPRRDATALLTRFKGGPLLERENDDRFRSNHYSPDEHIKVSLMPNPQFHLHSAFLPRRRNSAFRAVLHLLLFFEHSGKSGLEWRTGTCDMNAKDSSVIWAGY